MVGGGSKAHIGFHGVFDAASGQQLVMPNVILATYLGYLNFNYEAVLWMLSPRPLATHWLTAETTSQYGIFFEVLDPPRTVALPPGAESPQQQPEQSGSLRARLYRSAWCKICTFASNPIRARQMF